MGRLSPGPNEDNLNVMRSQMGLPLRLTYSGVLQKSTGVGILFGIYDKKGIAIPKVELKYKGYPNSRVGNLILNAEDGTDVK